MTLPLRVVRVIGRLNVGGPAMHVVNLSQGTDALRTADGQPLFRTRLVAGRIYESEGDMAYYARERGVEVTEIPEMSRHVRPWDDAMALAKLVRVLRDVRPHVVHTHTAKAGALGRLAAALTDVPIRVHTFHGHVLGGDYFSPAVTAFYRFAETQLARLTDRLVVLTEGQKHELAREHRVAEEGRFVVIPLGLELERFREAHTGTGSEQEGGGPAEKSAGPLRSELGTEPDTFIVGIVGRLVPIKNHELFLRALAELRRTVPAVGVVVGSGEREAELKALATELGVGDAVRWLGWRTDLPRLYAGMDVLALTSLDEGTPVAVIEALAAGVPVVARAVGGVPELLEGGRLGTLVRTPDPAEFARALRDALGAGRRAFPESMASREAIVRRFSTERLARDVADLYLGLAVRKGILEERPPFAAGSGA